ncbi:MAG: hypothetical protein CMI52_01050 [Parcubacteria group bacterium]|nr:hypothetical protein [Parcubacteria group bacterium]
MDNFENNPAPVQSRSRVVRISFIYFGVILVVSLLGFGLYALFFSPDEDQQKPSKVSGVSTYVIPEFDQKEGDKDASVEALKDMQEGWVKLGDRDGDGLSDQEELELGTDPDLQDSDGDMLADGQEIAKGTDPLHSDTDGDGISDWNDKDNGVIIE